jgi:23S rRNA (uracil1939-C5)-methyltransferase
VGKRRGRNGHSRPAGRDPGVFSLRGPERLELEIHALSSDGDGVARAPDGRVVFVPFSAPGDRVLARVELDRGRFVRARLERLLRASPQRVDPVCAVFGSCGGCAWQHVRYEAQLEAKRAILREALARVGGLAVPEPIPFTPSPSPWAYRSRARVLVRKGRVGFRRRRSHALCQTDRCPVLAPSLEQALGALARQSPTPDGEWELAAGSEGAAQASALPVAEGEAAAIELGVGKRRLRVSAGVFAQANGLLVETLAAAVESAGGGGALALELYAGAGLFTLGLAERFGRVLAVESDPRAARDLRHNLRSAGLGNVVVLAEPAERALGRSEIRQAAPDLVLVDPPRTGLGDGLAAALAALRAARFAYLSCDPATLARDAAMLVERGYVLASLQGFDLFPQTPHVEALALLELGGAPGAA